MENGPGGLGIHDEGWLLSSELGVRCGGAYQYEVELKNECLLRVGWAALEGRRALGTDERSFGYGGTGMKSNCGKFEQLVLQRQRCPDSIARNTFGPTAAVRLGRGLRAGPIRLCHEKVSVFHSIGTFGASQPSSQDGFLLTT